MKKCKCDKENDFTKFDEAVAEFVTAFWIEFGKIAIPVLDKIVDWLAWIDKKIKK